MWRRHRPGFGLVWNLPLLSCGGRDTIRSLGPVCGGRAVVRQSRSPWPYNNNMQSCTGWHHIYSSFSLFLWWMTKVKVKNHFSLIPLFFFSFSFLLTQVNIVDKLWLEMDLFNPTWNGLISILESFHCYYCYCYVTFWLVMLYPGLATQSSHTNSSSLICWKLLTVFLIHLLTIISTFVSRMSHFSRNFLYFSLLLFVNQSMNKVRVHSGTVYPHGSGSKGK